MRGWRATLVIPGVAAGLAGAALPHPAAAQRQEGDVAARVVRLESEMRAVQHKVFPGGAGRDQVVEPELGEGAAPRPAPGTPAAGALVDLTARVAALEGQLSSLTGQAEQNGYRLRQLQDQFDAYRRATDARLAALATAPAAPSPAAAPPADDGRDGPSAATVPPRRDPVRPAATRPAATAAARPPREAPAVDPAVAAVPRPASATAEEEYLYGYRLWQAKQFPAAEAQLKKVVATYPGNKRASYAQNLLGRAYLDEGKPSLASVAFYDNYKKMPDGERAPDSLYYLAQALMKLGKPADACKVYGELGDVYGAKLGAGMKADVARGRAAARCS